MSPTDVLDLSLGVQTALGGGYLAYITAYAGMRRDHGAEDVVFITLAFGLIAGLLFKMAEPGGAVLAVSAGVVSALAAGLLWRRFARGAWHRVMRWMTVHYEDGIHQTWHGLAQSGRQVAQISVHLKSGGVLYLNDAPRYDASPFGGLYLGGDGGIAMVVEEEDLPDGKEEVREDIVHPDWGTRLTYIPPDEIARVNIRMK